jgi:uncharacterized protein YoxC
MNTLTMIFAALAFVFLVLYLLRRKARLDREQ